MCTREVMAATLSLAAFAAGCDRAPDTTVVLDNHYPSSGTTPLVVYRAYWQAVAFQDPVAPGGSSDPESTVPASNTAYVLLAPGWDPDSAAPPTSFVVMQSRNELAVPQNGALHIPVDDTTFIGNCDAGGALSQTQADFIRARIFTETIFPDASLPLSYDAVTCTTTPIADAGAP
jgi:hypothetical protein